MHTVNSHQLGTNTTIYVESVDGDDTYLAAAFLNQGVAVGDKVRPVASADTDVASRPQAAQVRDARSAAKAEGASR
jgi:hypothetical protein